MDKIFYKEAGIVFNEEGKGRTIVLLHGFLEDRSIWKHLSTKLAASYRVISIDLPGHGGSDCLGYIHTMEEMAEAVRAVLKAKKIRRCVIVGHSMGGYAALATGDLYPDMVRGICLLHSSAADDTAKKKTDRNRLIEVVKKKKTSLVKELIPPLFAEENRKKFRRQIDSLIKRAEKNSLQGIIANLAGMRDRIDREIIVRFSPYPVHYIIGKKDSVFPYKDIIRQCEKSEKATYTLLENSGHMGFIEEREKTEEDITRFISKSFAVQKPEPKDYLKAQIRKVFLKKPF